MNRDTLADASAKLMNLGHRLILKVSGNRLLANPFGMPAVELHTTGRKSGLPRSCYLTAPVHDAHRVVLVASKEVTTAIRTGTEISSHIPTPSW